MTGPDRESVRVAAIVQARMSSARLPGKVLADVCGEPLLALLVRRLRRAEEIAAVLIATSVDSSDDAIEAAALGAPVFRGPLDDVLERYRLAAAALECDAVARVTGDCPLIDPAVVDAVVRAWRRSGADYASNALEPRTYPDGTDCEVLAREVLDTAAREAQEPEEREHVTAFVWRRPERFELEPVHAPADLSSLRYSVDTQADLDLVRTVVGRAGPDASLEEVAAALSAEQ